MRRALVATLGLAGVASATVPVLAAPTPVDEGRTAGIRVLGTLPGGDTLQLDISGSQLSTGPRLIIDAVRCDRNNDCTSQPYAGDLAPGALEISASDTHAALATVLDGRRLSIGWQPAPDGGAAVGGGSLEGDGADDFATEYSGTTATTTVRYDGAGCQGAGEVGDGVVLDTAAVSGSEVALPLSTLQLPDGIVFRC